LTSLDFEGIVTVFLGVLEKSTGRLTYCSAGHEPALLYRHASSTVEELPSGQPALVGLSVGPYASRAVTLHPQDVLFVYTDGLSESGTRPDGLLGVEGIANLLQAYARRGPGEILTRMCQTAAALSGHRLRDDIAMAALERLPDEGPESEPVEWRRCKCHAGGCCCYAAQGPD
jgi:serine phosphatase RsbU (regulator of sigma subunit)